MSQKINVFNIVSEHYTTLKNAQTNKYSMVDITVLVGFPFILSIGLVYLNAIISANASNMIITALSVFAGLLFNLLVLILDRVETYKRDVAANPSNDVLENARRKNKKIALEELYKNISFSILISIIDIVLFLLINYTPLKDFHCLYKGLLIVTYFFLGSVLMTLLMILKRTHNILSSEFPTTP